MSEVDTAADAALARLFDRFGIDVVDKQQMRDLGRDFVFLRSMREAAKEREDLIRRAATERPRKLMGAIAEKVVTFVLGLAMAYILFRVGVK